MLENLNRRDFLALTGASVAPLTGCLHIEGDSDWRMYGYDAGNTGYNPDAVGPKQKVSPDWKHSPTLPSNIDSGTVPDGAGSSPAVVDGTVYTGTSGRGLVAFDIEDGSELWNFEDGESVSTNPAVINGTVYVRIDDLHAVDTETGEEDWNTEVGGWYSSPTVNDGVVYIEDSDGTGIQAIDSESGEKLWTSETDFNDTRADSPAVMDGNVYFSHDGELYSINSETGEVNWTFGTADFSGYQTAYNGTVYSTALDNTLYAIDAGDGSELWKFEADRKIDDEVAVDEDRVYVSDSYSEDVSGPRKRGSTPRGNLYAVDTDTGERLWKYGSGSIDGRPAVADEVIYITASGNLSAFDAVAGELLWSYDQFGGFHTGPVVVDEKIYAGGSSYNIIGYSV